MYTMRRLLILTSLVLASACTPDLSRIHVQEPSPLPQNPSVSVATLSPSPSHHPETLITTINVVDKLNVPKWHLTQVLADWNKVKLIKFKLVKTCITYQPCVTVKIKNLEPYKPGEITVGQAEWGDDAWDMSITLNPFQLSAKYAQSTLCHEFGHIIGIGHVLENPKSSRVIKTCMKAEDDFAPVSPSYLDIKLANRLGPWSWEKSQETSGKDIDGEDIH